MSKIEELEENLAAVTSRLTILDKILKAAGLGQHMVMAFRCGESGLWFPANYVKEWGRLYGIGHGPHVVSETLQTEYDVAPPAITPETRTIEQIMHPVRSSMAQVDMDMVDQAAFDSQRAVLVLDDPHMDKRAAIVRGKQLINPRGRLRTAYAAWKEAH